VWWRNRWDGEPRWRRYPFKRLEALIRSFLQDEEAAVPDQTKKTEIGRKTTFTQPGARGAQPGEPPVQTSEVQSSEAQSSEAPAESGPRVVAAAGHASGARHPDLAKAIEEAQGRAVDQALADGLDLERDAEEVKARKASAAQEAREAFGRQAE
jgi:hypothetical protein